MNDPVISVNVDAKLALNKYNVDEGHAHIALSDDADRAEFRKLVLACPAALYKIDEDGGLSFDYAGCILCSRTIVERWEYPQPTMGVEYRYG